MGAEKDASAFAFAPTGRPPREATEWAQAEPELLAGVLYGFELAGRGVVVYLSGDSEARYASRNEIKEPTLERMGPWKDEAGTLKR